MNSRRLVGVALAVISGLILVWQLLNSTAIPQLSYTLEEVEIISQGRLRLHIVVNEPVTTENLQTIARQVVAEQDRACSAIELNFYDRTQYIGFSPTLGRAIYCPDGEWKGQDMDFHWNLKNKDWTVQPTAEEAEIWLAWQQEIMGMPENEDQATEAVARQYRQSPDDIAAILARHLRWLRDDN